LAMTGCGGEKSSKDSGDKVELNIMGGVMRLESMIEGWEQMIKNFEDENEGVTVKLDLQGEWNEIPQLLAQARMAGQKVDFVRSTGGVIRSTLAPAGALMDLTDVIDPYKDRFVEGTLDNYTVGGHLWGIPYGETTTSCIYYNKTMFDELELEEPKTLEDLVHCADVIKAEKGIKNPWIHQGAIVDYWQMWFAETYGQTSGNQSIAKMEDWLSGKSSFVNDETIAAFGKIREMFDKGILTTDSLDTDDTAMKALFAQQQAAMFYGGTWEYAPTLEIVDGAFEIGVFLWPSLGDGMSAQACGAADDGVAIASNCHKENWDYVEKFLDHMTNEESTALTLNPIKPIIPVIKSVKPSDLPCASELVGFMPDTVMFLDWMWPYEINNVLGNQIAGVASGHFTPEQAAQAMQDVYDKLVKEEGYKYNWYDSWTKEDWDAVTPK
ncbi:MAG: extracellular solute-binding protein, partial [Clostridia bacterium]|nr:extracellular solute-binding protein [Clostridia bacterium]